MPRTAAPLAISLLAGLLVPVFVSADVVHLRGGGSLRGRVTHQADVVVLDAGTWKTTIPRERILTIEAEPDPIASYAKRRAAMPDPPTPEAWTALGGWCAAQGLPDQAREAWNEAVRLDSDHEAARRALGHVRREGRWVTEDEFHAAQGDVKFRNRWMPREEMLAILDAEKASREARELADRSEREKREAASAEQRARKDADREAAEAARRSAVEVRARELEILRRQAELSAGIGHDTPPPVFLYPYFGYGYPPYVCTRYPAYPMPHYGAGWTSWYSSCGSSGWGWYGAGRGGGILRIGGSLHGTGSHVVIRR